MIEPNYKSKYPPIGLMKIAYYHKEILGDFVWFSKGKLPKQITDTVSEKIHSSKYYIDTYKENIDDYIESVKDIISKKRWDRVYVTTLFTFEWDKSVQAIEYAKTLIDDISKVYVGGILATLMPKEIEEATGIKPMTGLLTDSKVLGYDDKINIDRLTPNYSILDHTDYYYPMSENYIATATRGCGMKCSFCAVQTLEPDCVDYLPLKKIIYEINEKYGERRNLVLMDNNILKSKHREQIIQDIIDLGYGRDAKKINPKTGKLINVFVDFNQGLDMNFISEKSVELLSCIAIRPIRIAFDHISDKERYIKAVELADKSNTPYISNYLLYNTAEISGKGKKKNADTPKDLYDRCRINVELEQRLNERRKVNGIRPLVIYSFPMKCVPLGSKNRDFIGQNWSKKTISALQRLTHPAKGCIYSAKNCFEKTFGHTYDDFYMFLQAPALYHEKRHRHNNDNWSNVWNEWKKLYLSLNEKERIAFERLISDNKFDIDRYLTINSFKMRKLYIHYFHKTKFLEFLFALHNKNVQLFYELRHYIVNQCPDIIAVNAELLSQLSKGKEYLADMMTILFVAKKDIAA